MPNEPEFPANLKAFCQLIVERLGYKNITHVLDVLDENFDVVQDRALDCCFDQGLALVILAGEEGEGDAILIVAALILIVVVTILAFTAARIAPIPIG